MTDSNKNSNVERDIWVKLSQLESAIDDLERRVGKMEQAMYGNGSSKGVLSRLAVIEARLDELGKKISTSTIFTVGTFLGILVTIITLLVRGG